jgi:hypothetical protein
VHKLVAVIGYQGWLIIFPAFLLYAWGRGLRGRLAGLVLIGAMYLTQIVAPNYRLYEKMILVTGLVGGFFVILQMGELFLTAVRNKTTAFGIEPLEGQFLGLWFFGVFFYCIFVLTEGSARYILPLDSACIDLLLPLVGTFRNRRIQDSSCSDLEFRHDCQRFSGVFDVFGLAAFTCRPGICPRI